MSRNDITKRTRRSGVYKLMSNTARSSFRCTRCLNTNVDAFLAFLIHGQVIVHSRKRKVVLLVCCIVPHQ